MKANTPLKGNAAFDQKKRPARRIRGGSFRLSRLSFLKFPNRWLTTGLLADSQLIDDLLIAAGILSFQILQQASPLTHHD